MAGAKSERTPVVLPADLSTLSPVRALFAGAGSGAPASSLFRSLFPFPRPLSSEKASELSALLAPVSSFFTKIDGAAIDAAGELPAAVLASTRELGLWGLQIPEEHGGLGLSNTAYARVVEEFVHDPSTAVTLMAHQSIGLKGLLLCGTPAQCAKYLPKLASGEELAAFALTEPGTGSDAAGVKLTATAVDGGAAWELSGEKMWITNGGTASFYTVFARTQPAAGGPSRVTAFLVHRGEHAGVRPGPPEDKLGIRGSNTCAVHFDRVRVPAENVLGEVHGGFKVAMTILNNGRFGMGAATGGGIRRLIAASCDYANARKQFGEAISSFGLIQDKIARMATDAYAIEAMAYVTTARVDAGVDMSLEAAMSKVYGSEAQFHAVKEVRAEKKRRLRAAGAAGGGCAERKRPCRVMLSCAEKMRKEGGGRGITPILKFKK
jgi:acyl-CoA dehydrogenase family protein 9